jgi:hypothetical protein
MYLYQLTLRGRKAAVIAENLFDATYHVEQEDRESWFDADIILITEVPATTKPSVLALEQSEHVYK